MNDLAKRLVACKGWRWMPGMLAIVPRMTVGVRLSTGDELDEALVPLPDLTDPATLGCVLQLVRDAWGDHTIVVDNDLMKGHERHDCGAHPWWVAVTSLHHYAGHSEVEALVCALEAAP